MPAFCFPAPRSAPVDLQLAEPGVAVVTLNRPEARNAVSRAAAEALERAVEQVEDRADVQVAIVTGAGDRAFSAGADLKEVAAGGLDAMFTARGGFGGFVHFPRTKPWIAAVNGAALAGGFEIVLACDLAVASSDAVFGLPEARRGLIASAGGLYRLPRALPRALALELILTGETIGAARACELGLINRCVERAGLAAAALDLAKRILACAPLAVRESLAIARAAYDRDGDELRRLGDEAQARLQVTDDYREGAVAFTEKRPPRWRGR